MKMTKRLLSVCLLVVFGAATVSHAAMVSGPHWTTTPISSTKTDWSSTLSFPKFDSSLGTLLSVQLEIYASYDTVLTITNNATSSSSGWAKTELLVSVQDAGNNLVDPVLDLLTAPFNFSLDPGDSVTTGHILKSGWSDDTYTSAAVLSAFNGPGTIVLDASTLTYAVLSYTGGNTDAVQSTYASATGRVTYTYIPEPATLAAMAMGSLALLRRRR
jgi:hypothetical protein